MEDLLTAKEVAERLKISHLTVLEYLKKGVIRGRKVGRFWRVTEADLQAYLDSVIHDRDSDAE